MAKATTFVYPLKPKRTDFSFKGVFSDNGPREVGDIYRERLGGPLFPISRDAPRKSRWFCQETKCTYWTEGDGSDKGGECSGSCLEY